MAKKTIQQLKDKFKTGNFPTQSDYEDVFDSMLTTVTTDDVKGVGEDSEKTLTQIVSAIPQPIEYTAGDGINISDQNVISVEKSSDSSDSGNKKFVEILDDLDGSDAPVGTIAMFGGQTGKYTHGFIYEKKGDDNKKLHIINKYEPETIGTCGQNAPITPNQITIKSIIFDGSRAWVRLDDEGNVMTYTNSQNDKCIKVINIDSDLIGASIPPYDAWSEYIVAPNVNIGSVSEPPYQVWSKSNTSGNSIWVPLNVMNVIN